MSRGGEPLGSDGDCHSEDNNDDDCPDGDDDDVVVATAVIAIQTCKKRIN